MAKKRKKEKEEKDSYDYKPPEFDEEEYLRKEVRDTKALLVTIGFAAMIGIVSFGLTFTEPALGGLLGIIGIVALRHLYPMVGVDPSELEKKNWAGNIVMYLFTWLAVWILLTNPPFSDIAGPTIKDDKIYFENDFPGNWTRFDDETKGNLSAGENVSINATIVDNVKVDPDTVRITIRIKDGNYITSSGGNDMFHEGSSYWYVFPYNGTGTYIYTITAKDINGNEGEHTGSEKL